MDRRFAFEAVFAEHHTAVLRFVERRVDDREIARELTMDCFEIAWRRFDAAAPFGLPWLLKTAHNVIGDSYRKRDRERERLAQLVTAAHTTRPADERARERVEVAVAMAALRPAEREVLELIYWDGLSAEDAATVLACRPATVWKRLSRARSALRARLEDDPQASGARFPGTEVTGYALD